MSSLLKKSADTAQNALNLAKEEFKLSKLAFDVAINPHLTFEIRIMEKTEEELAAVGGIVKTTG